MELTNEHYRRAEVAYSAYCKQTGGKSLATGDVLPSFDVLRQSIKDAWAASAIALSLDSEMDVRRGLNAIDPDLQVLVKNWAQINGVNPDSIYVDSLVTSIEQRVLAAIG